ncbi:MAG: hypothetical protein IPL99_19480 [Candidatus Competibacteraceae bacterium]|nr:hypothetical protein [Candidatus Competibacteraceae bacterium]
MPELTRPTPAELDSMSHAEKDALILGLFDVLARYEQRLREVEGKVEKNEPEFEPASVCGWNKEGAGEAAPTGREALGGQPGHRGATREMVDDPDEVRELRPSGFCSCGAGLDGLPVRAVSVGSRSRYLNPRRW